MSRDYIGYVSLICRFIATQNYKSSWDLHQQKQVGFGRWPSTLFGVFRNAPDPWSYQVDTLVLSMDLTAGRTWDQRQGRGNSELTAY